MTFKRAVLYSFAINLFFLLLVLIFGDLRFGAIDDYFMAALLTGAHGVDYNPLMIFVNALYGYALLPWYFVFPEVGWYYVALLWSVFVSFWVIGLVLLLQLERWGALVFAVFVALLASDFYLVCQFTRSASILAAAGMLLFLWTLLNKRSAWFLCASVLLVFWASLLRYQVFLMGLPFGALSFLFFWRPIWGQRWRFLVTLGVLLLLAFGAHQIDKSFYKGEEYADFRAFQNSRVILGDLQSYNQQAVYEDLEESNLSGQDFALLKEWVFYDTEVFSPQALEPIIKTISRYSYQIERLYIPYLLLEALKNSVKSPLLWLFFALSLWVVLAQKRYWFYPWALLLMTLFLMAYLLNMSRLVYRVETGFWLYASVLLIPLLRVPFELQKKHFFSLFLLLAVVNIGLYAFSGEIVRDPTTGKKRTLVLEKDSTDYAAVFEYIDSKKDYLFLTSMNAYMRFSHHKTPPWRREPVGSYRNIISFGYWTPYLPDLQDALHSYGVKNPIKEVVKPNVLVINQDNLKLFLERHYYKEVRMDTVKVIGEMFFYNYVLVEER